MYNVEPQEPTENLKKLLGGFEKITSRNRSLKPLHTEISGPPSSLHADREYPKYQGLCLVA